MCPMLPLYANLSLKDNHFPESPDPAKLSFVVTVCRCRNKKILANQCNAVGMRRKAPSRKRAMKKMVEVGEGITTKGLWETARRAGLRFNQPFPC